MHHPVYKIQEYCDYRTGKISRPTVKKLISYFCVSVAVPTLKRKKRRKLNNRNDERRTSVNDYGVDAQNDVSDDDDDDHDDEENINDGDDDKSASSESDDDETLNTKFRRGEALPSDLDLDYNTEEGTEEDQESDGEWNEMGAALEREFLEGD